MEKDLVEKIEKRISELESQGNKINDFINTTAANIKKLLAEKVRANDEAKVIIGALQAFKAVLSEASEKEKLAEASEVEKEENV